MKSCEISFPVFQQSWYYLLAGVCLWVLSPAVNGQEVIPSALEVGSQPTFTQIRVEASGPWSVIEDVPWLTVSKVLGNGVGNITITVEANPTTSDRLATIDIG